MPPAQAGGEPLDPRSDLFSVGVLLYEMVSGQRPFQGLSTAAMAAAILTHEPLPLARFAPRTPSELERIVTKLLKKQPENRYQTAKDLLTYLGTLKGEQEFQLRLGRTPPPPPPQPAAESAPSTGGAVSDAIAPPSGATGTAPTNRWRRRAGAGIAALLVVMVGGWFAWRAANLRWARAQLVQVVALADAKRYSDAYDLAMAVNPYVSGDPTLMRVMPVISDTVSVKTDPSGATVYLKRFGGGGA